MSELNKGKRSRSSRASSTTQKHREMLVGRRKGRDNPEGTVNPLLGHSKTGGFMEKRKTKSQEKMLRKGKEAKLRGGEKERWGERHLGVRKVMPRGKN